ncbi:thioredoxin reductase [Gonapodya prolifera JEL478]|uniref:Thioredoxin reductase n=1 Tax=Gonapodya prolifera (strain JEL478) TaxID=1344416 RepID=A0A139ASB2_GONPJ|nr:thioredoxin reductase [Gonapodya prolifera JEL478]|eukprot:KXS19638.1 thioredoxin reductase [Gonapodya prolifera JEL478]
MPPIRNGVDNREHRKLVIIGSGPAGHTAAIYSARAELKPLMFEGFLAGGVAAGGQLTTTTDVENFPGFPTGISGTEITQKFREQSIHHGTEIRTQTVSKVDLSNRPFKVWPEGEENDDSKAILADALIIATGATAKRLHIPGEEKLWQRGISACAVCDGAAPLFRRKPLAVVGGGDTAAEEALFLTKYADKVYLLVRRDKMRASKVMRSRVEKHPKIEILYNSLPVAASGEKTLSAITVESTADGSKRELPVNGLFYAIGHQPNTQVFDGQIKLDETGYIVTKPGTTLTSVEGVFAAGDVQDFVYRQAITAAGTGCMAALEAERWLEAEEAEHCEVAENKAAA